MWGMDSRSDGRRRQVGQREGDEVTRVTRGGLCNSFECAGRKWRCTKLSQEPFCLLGTRFDLERDGMEGWWRS